MDISGPILILVQAVVSMCLTVVSWVVGTEPWLRDEMYRVGVSTSTQTILLLVLVIVVVLEVIKRSSAAVKSLALPVLFFMGLHVAWPMLGG